MANVIIVAVIVLAVVFVARGYIKKGGHSDCCGDSGEVRLKGPKDRDASHYSHAYRVQVSGMSCDNCAHRVANAFNAEDGMSAEVDLAAGEALVRTKEPVEPDALRAIVRNTGYGVGSVTQA